jgi:hypothetical protein
LYNDPQTVLRSLVLRQGGIEGIGWNWTYILPLRPS